MKDNHVFAPDALAQWFKSPRGEQFMAAETVLMQKAIARLFGAHCALSSVYNSPIVLEQIPCRRVYDIVSPNLHLFDSTRKLSKTIIAAMDDLPFHDDSLDGFVLLHTLDFVKNPHSALREVARVLRPGGQIIVVGFNPASLLGWARYIPGLRQQVPNSARFLGRHRLCDWLALLHFDVEYFGGSSLMPFRSALTHAAIEQTQNLPHTSAWSATRRGVGKVFRERFGSVYCLRVRKSHISSTLVGATSTESRFVWKPAITSQVLGRHDQDG